MTETTEHRKSSSQSRAASVWAAEALGSLACAREDSARRLQAAKRRL